MEVKPDTLKKGGVRASREKVDILLLLCVIVFAAAFALRVYLLDLAREPTEAEVDRADAHRLQAYTSKAECWQPLNAYCEDGPCPDFASAIARVERFVPYCIKAVVGTCGELRYTYMHDSFHSTKSYFDATGKLVAAHTTTDALSMNIECRNWTHYGPNIECQQRIMRDYCAPIVPERLPPRRGRKVRHWNPLVPTQ